MKNLFILDNQVSFQDYTKILIQEKKYDDAIDELELRVITDLANGENLALLALCYFLKEEYNNAIENYQMALIYQEDNLEWQDMLQKSIANAKAEVHVCVPAFEKFDREALLSMTEISSVQLPKPPAPLPSPTFKRKIKNAIEVITGKIASSIMFSLAMTTGKLLGYRDEIWTNWYNRPKLLAILTLAYMRRKLNSKNLYNSYPEGSLTGFVSENLTPPEGVSHYRTADGSWNNLSNPKEGAAGTRFTRNVDKAAIDAEAQKGLLSPNPRLVSNVLLTREDEMKEVPFLNMLAVSWIQFQTHDWVSHGEVPLDDVIEVPLPEDDPARKKYWQTKMFVGKTQADPTRQENEDTTPFTFINEVTHWWDGSQLYGSDQETIDRLRSNVDGKLRINKDGRLPLDKKGIEETGFTRNWWVGLSMLHTLFTKEHNAICDKLKKSYPEWNDSKLFNVARLINAALMAKIHSVEWTPAILPNHVLSDALHANWYGLITNLKSDKKRKTISDINTRNHELGGVVGNAINKHGQAYALTEEFVEVYRLHSLLPETLKLKSIENENNITEVKMTETRQAGSAKITKERAMEDLFFSFGTQHPGQLVLNNYPEFMKSLSIPGNPVYDLGAVDILRARERGVPRYNEFRRQLGLEPIDKFEDLTKDAQQIENLKKVYGHGADAVEQLDLLIGCLAETQRPTNFGFGETIFQIFILTASRRLQADRFFTDDYTAEVYTQEGLDWIDKNNFKSVLLRHYPELAQTGLANIKNAFEPWDTDKELDPERHPLRSFDKDLKPNPWLGEVYVKH